MELLPTLLKYSCMLKYWYTLGREFPAETATTVFYLSLCPSLKL